VRLAERLDVDIGGFSADKILTRSRLYLCLNGAQPGSTSGRRDPSIQSGSGQKCSAQQVGRNRFCAVPRQERKHSCHQTVSEYDKRECADRGQPKEPTDRRKKTDDQQQRVRKTKLNRERFKGAFPSEE